MRWFSVVFAAGVVGALVSFGVSVMTRDVGEVGLITDAVRGVGLVTMAVVLYEVFVHDLRVGWVSTCIGLGVPVGKLILERLLTYYLSVAAFVIGAVLASTEVFVPGVVERLVTQFIGDAAVVSLAVVTLAMYVPALRNESVVLVGAFAGGVRQYVGFALGYVLKSVGLGRWVITALHSWYPMLALSGVPVANLPLTDVVVAVCVDGGLILLSVVLPSYVFMRRCVRV